MLQNLNWRAVFGFILILIISILAIIITLGKVQQETAHGLEPLLIILSTLATKFGDWAFHSQPKEQEEDKR